MAYVQTLARSQDSADDPHRAQADGRERTVVVLIALVLAGLVPQLPRFVPWDALTRALPLAELPAAVADAARVQVWQFATFALVLAMLVVAWRAGARPFAACFLVAPMRATGIAAAVLAPVLYVMARVGPPWAFPTVPHPELLLLKTNFVWLALPCVVIVGPLVEELLFRGLLFRSLSQTFLGPLYAGLLSALLFGIGHFDKPPVEQLICFLHGLILCFLVHRTRTVLYGVVAHAAFNGYIALGMLIAVNRMGSP